MRIPKDRVAELGAEAFRRIQGSGLSDQEKYLLGECVEGYLPLDEVEKAKIEGILQTETIRGTKPMNVTSYQMGVLHGKEDGRDEGRRLMLLDILKEDAESKFESEGTRWFESVPADLPLSRLKELQKSVRSARTVGDLESFA